MPSLGGFYLEELAGARAVRIWYGQRECLLTKSQVQTYYQSTTGNAASRRAQVLLWIKEQIVAAIGPENLSVEQISFEVNLAEGGLTNFEVREITS